MRQVAAQGAQECPTFFAWPRTPPKAALSLPFVAIRDAQTLADPTAGKQERIEQGAGPGDPFICTQSRTAFDRKLHRLDTRQRFIRMCRVFGDDRQAELTINHGRHSFVSHLLAGGGSLAEVRDAAGHANIATTSVYIHIATDDEPGDLFDFGL